MYINSGWNVSVHTLTLMKLFDHKRTLHLLILSNLSNFHTGAYANQMQKKVTRYNKTKQVKQLEGLVLKAAAHEARHSVISVVGSHTNMCLVMWWTGTYLRTWLFYKPYELFSSLHEQLLTLWFKTMLNKLHPQDKLKLPLGCFRQTSVKNGNVRLLCYVIQVLWSGSLVWPVLCSCRTMCSTMCPTEEIYISWTYQKYDHGGLALNGSVVSCFRPPSVCHRWSWI